MSERFGLSEKTHTEIQQILEGFLRPKKNYSVSVFGSRASGKHRKYSDLDLLIECSPVLNDAELGQLRELFTDSELPFKIDIVTPETCLAEYRDRILSERQLWQEKR